MIPKIIHQTAPSDRTKWPTIWKECQKSIFQVFPNFEYQLWDDDDLEELVRVRYPWFLEQYLAYPSHIMRVDVARYMILDTFGGIYIDMDFEIYKDFSVVLPPNNVSIVESSYPETEYLQNSLMSSPRNHPFWNEVFRELMSTYSYYKSSVLDATGPRMLDRVYERYEPKKFIYVLPKDLFNPNPNPDQSPSSNVYSKHYYTAVWV